MCVCYIVTGNPTGTQRQIIAPPSGFADSVLQNQVHVHREQKSPSNTTDRRDRSDHLGQGSKVITSEPDRRDRSDHQGQGSEVITSEPDRRDRSDHQGQGSKVTTSEPLSVTGARHIVRPNQLQCSIDYSQEASNSLERRDVRGSMTKIKTNGSLAMISSPNNAPKDYGGFQTRRGSSNSSNSEGEESTSASEDTGTIKRRPILMNDQLRWKDTHPDGRDMTKVSPEESVKSPHFSPIMGSRSPKIGRRGHIKHEELSQSQKLSSNESLSSTDRKPSDENANDKLFANTGDTNTNTTDMVHYSGNGNTDVNIGINSDIHSVSRLTQNGDRQSMDCPKFPVIRDYNSIYENVQDVYKQPTINGSNSVLRDHSSDLHNVIGLEVQSSVLRDHSSDQHNVIGSEVQSSVLRDYSSDQHNVIGSEVQSPGGHTRGLGSTSSSSNRSSTPRHSSGSNNSKRSDDQDTPINSDNELTLNRVQGHTAVIPLSVEFKDGGAIKPVKVSYCSI